jgi:Cytochrome c7 and related cytochrome c
LTQLFPKWTNKLPAAATALLVLGAPSLVFSVWYYFSPQNTDVGYTPDQPIPYSHKQHAGLFGMDCRYCHQNVERGPHATIPSTQTCVNCHWTIRTDSEVLQPIRDTFAALQAGEKADPIEWIKVHMLPDYAYFDHSAHVAVGVGCESCHGRVDQMQVVRQVEPLSMAWCLECHRNPENHVRPVADITKMGYQHDIELARQLIKEKNINPPTHCSACHR